MGNGGPSDLIFEISDETVVIEFKIASTWNAYENDILKLQRLKTDDIMNCHKYFVTLIDQFTGKQDGRIDFLENLGLSCLGKERIPVQYSAYKGEVTCVICLYQID